MKKKIGQLLWVVIYLATAVLLINFIKYNGLYPSGSDTMAHLYRSNVLFENIRAGQWIPVMDYGWYNGVESLRYFAPLPSYVLALIQFICGGDIFDAYLVFIALLFVVGAVGFLAMGSRVNRVFLGGLLGLLWFFMPSNMHNLFVAGNLPRAMAFMLLPYLVGMCVAYVRLNRVRYNACIIAVYGIICLTGVDNASIVFVSMLIFLLIYGLENKDYGRPCHVIVAMGLGFMVSSFWTVASVFGEGHKKTATVPVNYGWISILMVIIIILGVLAARKSRKAYFITALIMFILTSSLADSLLVNMMGEKNLWFHRLVSVAVCMVFVGLLVWKTLKKWILAICMIILAVTTVPFASLVYGTMDQTTPEDRFTALAEETLLDEAKEITTQRLAVFDMGELEANGAFVASTFEKKTATTFGYGFEASATSENVALLNEALSGGHNAYLFDRCVEYGTDTVLIDTRFMYDPYYGIDELDDAAKASGFKLVDSNERYRLYHLKGASECFGSVATYEGIAIGTSAPIITLDFPSVKSANTVYVDDYSLEELSQYKVIYLAGFSYHNRANAEKLLMDASDKGVRVVILADGLPSDETTQTKEFLGVTCFDISFAGGYPELDTIDGMLICDLFPSGYTRWNSVYVNGLDEVWGTLTDLDKPIDFYGTKYNDNIVFIGLNLTYHYALTHDKAVGELLSHALDMDLSTLPDRKLVDLDIEYGQNAVTIKSDYDHVCTGLAFHDIYRSSSTLGQQFNILYVDKGTTIITFDYSYFYIGIMLSVTGLIIAFVFFRYLAWLNKSEGSLSWDDI